jgi:hypothetical protein
MFINTLLIISIVILIILIYRFINVYIYYNSLSLNEIIKKIINLPPVLCDAASSSSLRTIDMLAKLDTYTKEKLGCISSYVNLGRGKLYLSFNPEIDLQELSGHMLLEVKNGDKTNHFPLKYRKIDVGKHLHEITADIDTDTALKAEAITFKFIGGKK